MNSFLHIMLRVNNLDNTIHFFNILGFKVTRRFDQPQGRFTLVYLQNTTAPVEIEMTYNWDQEASYSSGDNFGHIAIGVNNIYQTCEKLMEAGAILARPPRDGLMAFIKSPDDISIELLQIGQPQPVAEPWCSMENMGTW